MFTIDTETGFPNVVMIAGESRPVVTPLSSPCHAPVTPLSRPYHALSRPVTPLSRPVTPLSRPVTPLSRPCHAPALSRPYDAPPRPLSKSCVRRTSPQSRHASVWWVTLVRRSCDARATLVRRLCDARVTLV
eukprot:1190127-Prorocentrum_minimum.AAC.2